MRQTGMRQNTIALSDVLNSIEALKSNSNLNAFENQLEAGFESSSQYLQVIL